MWFFNSFACFVVLWGCAWTQEIQGITTTNLTDGSMIVENVEIPGAISTTERVQSQGSTEKDEQNRNITADSLIDRIIDLAIKHIKEKTTGAIKLSDEKFLVIPIKGEMVLYNGELNGINSIKRTGDANYAIHNGQIDVNTTFQFDELDFIYDFQANIYKLSTDGVCKGNLTKLVTDIGLKIKIKEKEIELTRLKLLAAKTLRIQLDSTKFKDKVINYVLKTVTSIFKKALLTQMEKELQEYVGKSIHYSYSDATMH